MLESATPDMSIFSHDCCSMIACRDSELHGLPMFQICVPAGSCSFTELRLCCLHSACSLSDLSEERAPARSATLRSLAHGLHELIDLAVDSKELAHASVPVGNNGLLSVHGFSSSHNSAMGAGRLPVNAYALALVQVGLGVSC